MERTFKLEDIHEVAQGFLEVLGSRKVAALHGAMGAGKTTFVKAVCRQLEVKNVVSSPTFSIINEYRTAAGSVFHLDLYRLKDDEEALRAGVEDCLYSGDLCLVEWPEKAPSVFPEAVVDVYLEVLDEITRRIVICDK